MNNFQYKKSRITGEFTGDGTTTTFGSFTELDPANKLIIFDTDPIKGREVNITEVTSGSVTITPAPAAGVKILALDSSALMDVIQIPSDFSPVQVSFTSPDVIENATFTVKSIVPNSKIPEIQLSSDGVNYGNVVHLGSVVPGTTYSFWLKATLSGMGHDYDPDIIFLDRVLMEGEWVETTQVACGVWHTVAIKTDGTLWGLGSNEYGQIGGSDTGNKTSLTQIGTSNDWIQVACGYDHTVALKQDGTLWGIGNNDYGQIGGTGNKSTLTQIEADSTWIQVACGHHHTVAIKTDGTLWGLGYNEVGQIGGTGNKSTLTQIETSNDWIQVACGAYHTVALKTDGTLWGLGYNYYGQIGGTGHKSTLTQIGTANDWAQVACGPYNTVALKSDGTLWGLGRNNYGQIGGTDTSNKTSLTQIEDDTDWILVSGGFYHTVALKADGTMWGLGYNNYGQIGGTGNKSTLTQIESDTNWVRVSCGAHHTVALKADGTLWGLGNNAYGQIGGTDTTNKNVLTSVESNVGSLVIPMQVSRVEPVMDPPDILDIYPHEPTITITDYLSNPLNFDIEDLTVIAGMATKIDNTSFTLNADGSRESYPVNFQLVTGASATPIDTTFSIRPTVSMPGVLSIDLFNQDPIGVGVDGGNLPVNVKVVDVGDATVVDKASYVSPSEFADILGEVVHDGMSSIEVDDLQYTIMSEANPLPVDMYNYLLKGFPAPTHIPGYIPELVGCRAFFLNVDNKFYEIETVTGGYLLNECTNGCTPIQMDRIVLVKDPGYTPRPLSFLWTITDNKSEIPFYKIPWNGLGSLQGVTMESGSKIIFRKNGMYYWYTGSSWSVCAPEIAEQRAMLGSFINTLQPSVWNVLYSAGDNIDIILYNSFNYEITLTGSDGVFSTAGGEIKAPMVPFVCSSDLSRDSMVFRSAVFFLNGDNPDWRIDLRSTVKPLRPNMMVLVKGVGE